MINEKQIGYIEISKEYREDFWHNNKIFIPIKIVDSGRKDVEKVLCFCDKFREIQTYEKIPFYDITYKKVLKEETIVTDVTEV